MPFITNESFVEWISGKRVALVGPASSAHQFKQGDKIESYDLVCRVKSFYVPSEKKDIYGSRVDILYTDNDETNDVLPGDKVEKRTILMSEESIGLRKDIMMNQIQAVVSTYPASEWFFDRFVLPLKRMAQLTNVRILPDEPYSTIRKETFRPNAGFSAILDLASLPISELYITGIDFYRSLYREDYLNSLYTKETILSWNSPPFDGFAPDGQPDRHDPDLQFKYFKHKIWKGDERIKTDPFMEMVLKDDRYEDFETAMLLSENK